MVLHKIQNILTELKLHSQFMFKNKKSYVHYFKMQLHYMIRCFAPDLLLNSFKTAYSFMKSDSI